MKLSVRTTRRAARSFGWLQSRSTDCYSPHVFQSAAFSTSSPCFVRIAIVGSGPSGCYTAKYLLQSDHPQVRMDILERLPTPYGLVRYGVAPDHPEVKNVQNDFDKLLQQSDRIQLMANVNVGSTTDGVSIDELRQHYDAVVLCYGCESDQRLNIPGADLNGVESAREFVAWYNGHMDYANTHTTSFENQHVVVIGQGNVALDCARILAKGRPGLEHTDIASHALPLLGNGAQCVTVMGRRGHVQGAFTIKELRELTKLQDEGHGVRFVVSSKELDLGGTTPASVHELMGPGGRPKVRIDKLLRKVATSDSALDDSKESLREVRLRFLLKPVRFEPDPSDPSRLGAVVCERTRLEGEPGEQKAIGTGVYETIPASTALVSIGYKGIALPGLEPWFEERRGILLNSAGRVDPANESKGGLYVAGWLKRGPSGIIGTNIADAKETVATLVQDLIQTGSSKESTAEKSGVHGLLKERGVQVVDWSSYEKIDATERSYQRKRNVQQPREKIVDKDELLAAALQQYLDPRN